MTALQAVVVAVALTGVAAYYDQSAPTLQQVAGVPAPDPETASYLLPRLAHKYRPPTGDWFDVPDPRLYLLTENENEETQVGHSCCPIKLNLIFRLSERF